MNPEPSQPTVVVVDDDPGLVALLVEALGDAGYRVEGHADPLAAIEAAVTGDVDTLITDVRMRDLDGLEVCRSMAQRRADVPVIVLTAFGSLDTAVRAMRAGAFDFLSKPIDLDALELAVARAVEHHRLTCEVTRLRQAVDEQLPDGLVGESLPMQHLNERLRRAARADVPVLLTGETGTGKELAARTLLGLSERAQAPFVAVNCAALPEPLLESELFGHVRGAFTDARTARAGLFVEAGEGVIFLDEVGEMPLGLQPKLLRALQERAVRPVGADRPVPIKCRVISATNRDLKAEVSAGRFRSDLYYRLAVIRLDLPPLRLRGPDILTLAQHFLRRSATRLGRSTKGLSRPVAAALLAYDWPGNVR
ncbi:MAG: sigma-54-dependent Fis family transcriptional regulator, partial [Myxococcales bacterium]|nr:sigma-54-dependent Fis family transcriptional regulator [Myxococcales bacterium]